MPKQKLTDVPQHILGQPRSVKDGTKWQGQYNVAVWLRFEKDVAANVRLMFAWRDEAGEHILPLDQATRASATTLLSGIAQLKISGQIEKASVVLDAPYTTFKVEELFVQPIQLEAPKTKAANIPWASK